jgi:hypothetical protein
MRTLLGILAAVCLAACGDNGTTIAAPSSTASAAPAATSASAPTSPGTGLGNRSGELVNPDESTMVFLYYDLAGMTPPIDDWVEEDNRVKYAQPLDKPAKRKAVRSELEAAAAAVRGMGFIRLTMHANLSQYDPTYGEFSVQALAPSSMVSYDALGQKVSLRFGNGRLAQLWRVPADEAQAIRDKVGYGTNVSLDALLRITDVLPGPGGGSITTDVIEYEMREARSGLIGRVRVAQQ